MLFLMRYMGIDYGSKRVGIALTDEGGAMAFPHKVLQNSTDLVKDLVALIEEKQVEAIVIGHSLNRNGEPNAIHGKIEELMTDLTLAVGIPIHLHPEQYTTQEALRIQGRTDKTDASAATLILNSFLDTHK